MSEYLFSYGTLQPGLAPREMAAAVSQLREVEKGFVCGMLYDLGSFPGAVIDLSSELKIFGTVYRLPQDTDALRRFDEYEEFIPGDPGSSLFLRVLTAVTLQTGATLSCWMYVYNRPTEGATILKTGQFLKPGVT
jgi:gamma-glutamylcyclotransferase (GGCT)/AIG2-like uncharacterized protein YtfP